MTYFREDLNIRPEDQYDFESESHDFITESQYTHNRIMQGKDDWYSILDE